MLSGCGDKPGTDECGYPKPAFALTLATDTGASLPAGTMVLVMGGGGNELVDPSALPASPKIAFCHVESKAPDKSDLVCALWTDGATSVDVHAPGYKHVKRDFEAKSDRCGIITTDVSITLQKDDGTSQ